MDPESVATVRVRHIVSELSKLGTLRADMLVNGRTSWMLGWVEPEAVLI